MRHALRKGALLGVIMNCLLAWPDCCFREEVVKYPRADPNVLDKNQNLLLHRVIQYQSRDFFDLLGKTNRVNYNKKSPASPKTALDVALKYWPDIRLLRFFSEHNNNELQEKLFELLEKKDQETIAYLIANQLININQPNQRGLLPFKYIYTPRSKQEVEAHPEYCLCPATFVKHNIPIDLFNQSNGYGIILLPTRIIAWCSGLDGQLITDNQDDIDFSQTTLKFESHQEKHQCQNRTTSEVAIQMQRLYEEFLNECNPIQKYEYLAQLNQLGWNEGLFYYKKADIIGFYVTNNSKNAYYALQLRQALNLKHLGFYTYKSIGGVSSIEENKVIELSLEYYNELQKKANKPAAFNDNQSVRSSMGIANEQAAKQKIASHSQQKTQSGSKEENKSTQTRQTTQLPVSNNYDYSGNRYNFNKKKAPEKQWQPKSPQQSQAPFSSFTNQKK